MSKEELYVGREQTLVKHFILEKYLERFAHIIGFRWDTITYIDCFAGPWNVQSENLEDSSFYIAVNQLRRAKATHGKRGHDLNLRCFFLEKDKTAYFKLKQFSDETDYATIETQNAAFEDSIEDIIKFVQDGGSKAFSFIFIDPPGWTGFAMEKIAPLLRIKPSEVLINFMTSHIRRFIESPDAATQASFDVLFGEGGTHGQFEGLSGIELDDALASAYCKSVAAAGSFEYVRTAIVLHPEIDKTHFHLIYATRNRKGVEVFKDAEKNAMRVMESARADVQKRERQRKMGQGELFSSETLSRSTQYESLRQRYTCRSRDRVLGRLRSAGQLTYDEAWDVALSEPLVWESDLRDWIKQWKQGGQVRIEGLKPREYTPKLNKHHMLVWQEDEDRGDKQ